LETVISSCRIEVAAAISAIWVPSGVSSAFGESHSDAVTCFARGVIHIPYAVRCVNAKANPMTSTIMPVFACLVKWRHRRFEIRYALLISIAEITGAWTVT
jgi:hypothetical protein